MAPVLLKILGYPKYAVLVALMLLLLLTPGTTKGQTGSDNPETTEQDGEKKKKAKKKSKEKAKNKKKDKNKVKKTDGEPSATPTADDSLGAAIARVQDTTTSVLDTTDTHAAWLCARYHTGKMYFIDKNYFGIKIKRKRKKEIWYNLTTDNKLTFKIEWESPCHYKLTFKKSKKPTRFRKGTEISCKITACVEDYYDCVCDVNAIMQYVSVQKDPTKAEIKLKAKQEKAKLEEEEKAIRMAEQKAKFEEGGETGEDGQDTSKKEGDDEDDKDNEAENKSGTEEVKVKKEKKKEKKNKKEKEPKEKKSKEKDKKEKKPKEKKDKKEKEKGGEE